jgi:hypothetical protein
MRGGAQAHLLLAEDKQHYVVKMKENPQHRRVLVNEWVASILLEQLEIPTPRVDRVELTPDFLAANPEVHITLGNQTAAIAPGWHFGSQLPVDPNRFVIYDVLPDALLRQVANLRDFLGILVYDKWVNNCDSRQAVFFRAQIKDWISGETSRKTGFVALMIDHGYIFGGPEWVFQDSPLAGLYYRPLVYESVRGLESFQPWLDMVCNFPWPGLDRAFRETPEWWLNGDSELLEKVLEKLYRRRQRVPYLLDDIRDGRVNPFTNWPK